VNPIDRPPRSSRPETSFWLQAQILPLVSSHNFSILYRFLQVSGYSEARIGWLTGQSQPEVSAIIHGRQVMAYQVIDRVVTGLGIPRCLAGMGTSCEGACPQHLADNRPVCPSPPRRHQHPIARPHPWTPGTVDL
jgi:hypothetical protein